MKFDQNGKRKLLNYSSFLGFEIMEYFAFKLQFLSHKQFQSVPTLNRIWTDLLFDFEKKKKCCAKSYSNFISSGTILELNVKLDVETVKWNLFETWNVSVNYVNRCNSPWMRDYSVYFSSSIVSINVSKISCINCSILGARFHPAWFMSNHAWFCKEFSLKTKVWIIITNEFYKSVERNFVLSCF